MNDTAITLSDIDLAAFRRDGFLVARSLADRTTCVKMREVARDHLAQNLAPVEYEVDVRYPGSPTHADAEGGQTVRRLLHAYARNAVYRDWATSEPVAARLRQLFACESVVLSQCHHNCMMTKQPGYSSATLWHQDNRYWSFDHQNLISVWLALGDETRANGCLRVLPGSHLLDIESGRFDAALFLRTDLPANKELVATAKTVELAAGDVLFFHSRLFHAAGRNLTDETKFSLVFTYHEADNKPIEGTRSSRFPGINL
ncbi:MAG TPA: phytanoyl-CoA dioxygenase family protein [Pseudomonadales bacterium]|nr:phytanoyl-CoA dioxygenase family protein [Pseudomonadales bacterium]